MNETPFPQPVSIASQRPLRSVEPWPGIALTGGTLPAFCRIGALLLALLPVNGEAGDRIGEIVEPATGTGRAVYAPLDQPVILPRFMGRWSLRPGICTQQKSSERMELDKGVAIIAGHAFTVVTALVDASAHSAEGSEQMPRAGDYAYADDLLVGFDRGDGNDLRYIHFHFSLDKTRLIFEEVGQPRRAYLRCS